MSDWIPTALRTLVRKRSEDRCEYCLIHEDDCALRHQPDHIISRKHGGQTNPDNLANACALCNSRKGSDIASTDTDTGDITRLFNPRIDVWTQHFRLDIGRINPLTPEGRATVSLLQLNRPELVQQRHLLTSKGRITEVE